MPGFDWNGNGKKDSFDHFMDNKVMSETSEDKTTLFLVTVTSRTTAVKV